MGRVDTLETSKQLLNVQQAAEFLGVNPGTIRRWAQTQELIGTKMGIRGDWRFTKASLMQMLKTNETLEDMTSPDLSSTIPSTAGKNNNIHIVQFYENDDHINSSLFDYIHDGLQAQEACVLIAIPEHISALENRLIQSGVDLKTLRASGQYQSFYAGDTLKQLMIGGLPDPIQFMNIVGTVIGQAHEKFGKVRAYGEMVALLWAEGNAEAVLQLEQLWNKLASHYEFKLYCSYPLNSFNKVSHGASFAKINQSHTHVIPAESHTEFVNKDEHNRFIAMLQQKAMSLENEIRERKHAEQAVGISELRYRRLFETAEDGLLIIDAETNIIQDVNHAAETLIGQYRDELLGSNLETINIFKNCPASLAKLRTLPEKRSLRHETYITTGHNSKRDLEIIAGYYNEGARSFIQLSLRDITARKKAKHLETANTDLITEKSMLMKLNKAKDEFISIASHQLRTPATGVKQYVGLLLEGYTGELTASQKEFLENAYASNERQIKIVNDLLLIAKVDSGSQQFTKKSSNLVKMVQDIVDEQKSSITNRNQTIKIISPDKITAIVDPVYIRMAIENLISNAIKYSHDKAKITITIENKGKEVCIHIADPGVGIKKSDQHKLFRKFSRIHNERTDLVEGTGLGLYWTKKVVENHGGNISLQSKINQGSVFTITLPK